MSAGCARYCYSVSRPALLWCRRRPLPQLAGPPRALLSSSASGGGAAKPSGGAAGQPEHDILMTSRHEVAGHDLLQDLGTISAAHVGSKNLLIDIYSALRGAFGGEVRPYSDLVNETRDQAVTKLLQLARREGATAIVKLRFEQALTMNRMVFGMHVSVLVYGTAVVTRPRQGVYQSSTR